MNNKFLTVIVILSIITFFSCSDKIIALTDNNLKVINRDISSIKEAENAIKLNNKIGDGMAIIEGEKFKLGTIELEIKGEDIRGRSFVGVAFNVQNDSTYEAIYFRPFNFQADKKINREHSVQYISHPKNSWRFLRTNYEGKFEAEYQRQPSPNAWFKIRMSITEETVEVFDADSNSLLLSVKRLEKQKSDRIALWMGYNSKGEFRNLKIEQ